jgi:ABC-2 type transport system permease protein
MHFVLASARKDLVRRSRDPAALIVWLGIPFVILALMTLAFGSGFGGGSPKIQAHLLLVDSDKSVVSGLFASAFGQGPLAELIRLEAVDDEATARESINEGNATALLVIPDGFGEAVLRSQPTELKLWTNPAQHILPGIVEETIGVFVDGTFYLQQLLGEPLETIATGVDEEAFNLAQVTAVSTEIYQLVERIQTRVFPPAIELTTAVITEEASPQEDLGFGNLFYPGIFFMAIFFVAQGLSDDIWIEKKNGTLHRSLRIHGGGSGLLLGKLGAGAVLLMALSVLSLVAGGLLFGIAWTRVPLATIWAVVSGCTLLALFTLLQVVARTQRAAVLVSNLVMFPLLILGGSLFPTEAMPAGLLAIGRWTPNGWALIHLKKVFAGSAGVVETLPALAAMLAMTAVFVFLTQRRLVGRFAGSA